MTADLPWKLPNTVVEMLSGQMQPLVWPSENARKSTAADQKYIAQRNSFGPPGTGKTNIIAHIVILGTAAYDITCQDDSLNARMERLYTARAAPLFLVVTATNSAADHVALAIKKLAKDMAKAPHQNYQGKRLRLGNVVLMRKYSKLVPTSAVPQELFSCSNKDQGRKFDPQKISCIVMTMGHAKAFKYLSRVCPILRKLQWPNLFEFFGVCCRFDMNTTRSELLNKCREVRHQRQVHSMSVFKPSTACVAKDLQEDASDDDCWGG
uniref:Uncharacterized protein n=1 Tax=Globodera rostochiensis TaxID=31243 RepID=A0A914HRD8_GLORO